MDSFIKFSFVNSNEEMQKEADKIFHDKSYRQPYSILFNDKLKSILYISDQGVREAFKLFNCNEIFISIPLENGKLDDRNYGVRLHDDGTREIFHDKISFSMAMYSAIRNTCKSEWVLVLNGNQFWYNRYTNKVRDINYEQENNVKNFICIVIMILIIAGLVTLI